MKKKILCLLLILTLSCLSLTGCYSTRGLETLAYAVAIGIDKGEGDNKLKLTLQLAVLSNSSGEGGGSSQSQESTITSVNCSSIDTGISLVNSYISKKINLSHCKAVVFSEEFAYDGLSEEVFTLINNIEVRPDCNIIISRCDASDYLENVDPTLESVSARYYELILNSSEYTAYSQNIALKDFYNNLLDSSSSPCAILGGINSESTQKLYTNSNIYDTEGSYKADETPIVSPNGIENMGLAVFSGDKLVGELDGSETLSHMLITNNLKSAVISVPNPYDQGSVISLYITQSKNTKNFLKFLNNYPYITCDISLTANILSLEEGLDYSNKDILNTIQEYANACVEQNVLSYLYKTAKEYKADIAGFSKYGLKNYLTWQDWVDSNWTSNYQNSFFTVNVDTTIQNGQLFTKI